MSTAPDRALDVFCIGHASYDLVFAVPHHPDADEKLTADGLVGCGGGPAANAAVAVARLGGQAAFCGYLGKDLYGEQHLRELRAAGVATHWLARGADPTPLSVVLVKPDGRRALVNYRGATRALPGATFDFSRVVTRVALFDGHEPALARRFLEQWPAIPTVLDAGSLHDGTRALLERVDYLLASEKFARQYAGDADTALTRLAAHAPAVAITLGERGLIWRRGLETGRLAAPAVRVIDTTGAGDAFHGAFAAALAAGRGWIESLGDASVAGAWCCTRMGARPGLPDADQQRALWREWRGAG